MIRSCKACACRSLTGITMRAGALGLGMLSFGALLSLVRARPRLRRGVSSACLTMTRTGDFSLTLMQRTAIQVLLVAVARALSTSFSAVGTVGLSSFSWQNQLARASIQLPACTFLVQPQPVLCQRMTAASIAWFRVALLSSYGVGQAMSNRKPWPSLECRGLSMVCC